MASNQTFTLNIKALFDASDVRAKVGEIQNAFKSLKLPDNLKNSLSGSFSNVEKALNDFESRTAKGVKTKADATGLTRSMDKVISEFTKLSGVVDKVKAEIGNTSDLSKIIQIDDATIQKIGKLKKEISDLQEQISEINASKITDLENKLSKINGKKAGEYGKQALDLFKQGDIEGAINLLDEVIKRYDKLQGGGEEKGARFGGIIAGFKELKGAMEGAKTDVAPLIDEINQKSQQIGSEASDAFGKTTKAVNDGATALNNYTSQASSAREGVDGLGKAQAQLNTELDQVKSRIVYFLGLSNAVNLFKRSIRSAFNTVKELDAAMTETAVVTDKTISDMWAQLPEYTARANSLGVTTLDAYKAATLYYQQGLNDQQTAELSVETLRMARIAGLEAADATDRMTNALRGFNMELNAMNAQRIDDVYSQLAAMSASNVDEISTAMTKVASLAHNANMDFETTAAFLAQIIETTRESAETAGTALKTVVARFSEVKKLVSEDQLKGQDEEGQVIDVNKVSQALRTAGIDLNKYFVGEVGLDDIFMELASKWDSLTSVQQRYIATQAAGSRQQSRFIAMMQDYARTQELVSAAYNSNGASAKQFEKTQDSLQSKLARLKNAWDAFLMGITNNGIIKSVVDVLTFLLNALNKIADAFGPAASGAIKFGMALGSLAALRKIFVTGDVLTKLLGGLGNSPIGKLFGLGGNKVGLSGGKANTSITELGNTAATGTTINTAQGMQIKAAGEAGSVLIKAAGEAGAITVDAASKAATTKITSEETGAAKNIVGEEASAKIRETSAVKAGQIEIESERQGAMYNTPIEGQGKIGLFGKLGNAFVSKTRLGGAVAKTGISKGMAGLLGKFGVSAGAATGVAALATTLGAIAAAGLAIYGVVKLVKTLNPTLEEQIKKAEENAKLTSETATKTKNQKAEMERAQEGYSTYDEAVNNSITNSERSKAIKDRNEYITSLLEQNAAYAKYLHTTFENGEIVLTLDSDALAKAVNEIADAAVRVGAYNAVAQAQLSNLRYQRSLKQAYDNNIDLLQYIINPTNLKNRADFETDQEYSQYLQHIEEAEGQRRATQNYLQQAAAAYIPEEISDEQAELITKYLGETLADANFSQILVELSPDTMREIMSRSVVQNTDVGLLFGQNSRREAYEEAYIDYYGVEPDKELTDKELEKLVDEAAETEAVFNVSIGNIESLLSGENASIYEKLISASIGSGLENVNLSNINPKDISEVLGIDENRLNEYINKLAEATGQEAEVIRKRIIDQITLAKQIQRQTKQKIFTNTFKTGASLTPDQAKWITNLEPEQARQLEAITSKAGNLLNGEQYQELLENLQNKDLDWSKTQELLDSINLDKPIDAFLQLQKVIETNQNQLGELAQGILDTNKIAFSSEALFLDFINSDSYAEITKSLDKFIEKNGEISSSNILELAESNEKLNQLLQTGVITSKALAVALTGIEKGTIAATDLTSSIISALNAMDDLDGVVKKTIDDLNNFDPGYDENDVTEFIKKVFDFSNEQLEKGAIGNNQMERYMEHIFGPIDLSKYPNMSYEDAYSSWLQGNLSWLEANQDNMKSAWEDLLINGPEEVLTLSSEKIGGDAVRIWEENGEILIDTAGHTTEELIQILSEGSDDLTEQQLRMMIADYKNYSGDFKNVLQQADTEKAVLEWYENLGEVQGYGRIIVDKELEALAELLGTNGDKIRRILRENGKQFKQYNWNDDLSVGENVQGILDQAGYNYWTEINVGEIFGKPFDLELIDYDKLKSSMDKAGLSQYFGETLDEMLKEGDQFATDFGTVTIQTGETASEAYQRALEEFNRQDLADRIGEKLKDLNIQVTIDGKVYGQLDELQTTLKDIERTYKLVFDGTIDPQLKAILTLLGNLSPSRFIPGGPDKNVGATPVSEIGASGGIVGSYANGSSSNKLKPGMALTGEEAPEIVWNKEKGYAYITGARGPQFQNLKPGDQVFNGQETKKILNNSGQRENLFGSYAKGKRIEIVDEKTGDIYTTAGKVYDATQDRIAHGYGNNNNNNNTGSGDNGNKSSKDWKNELDWLYDLMEDIAEEEHKQTLIQSEYEFAEKDLAKTGRDLYNLTKAELDTLQAQLSAQQFAFEKRLQQMNELQQKVVAEGFEEYLRWNSEDNSLEIDWDKINEITDKDTYDKLSDLVSDMEKVQDQMDEAQEATLDIKKQIQELQTRYLQAFLDFQDKVKEAVVAQYQQVIDNLSTLNDTINDTNQSILDSIQKEIDLQRQIRDNTDTEKEIADMEARLAMLQRDTTGANQQEILKLQKQLDEARKNYSDTLTDQAIDRLSQNNDDAQEQREKQIELLQAQLEYWQETGALWEEVAKLIADGFTSQGSIIQGSELWEFLKDADSWNGLSQAQKENWANELILESAQVGAYLTQLNDGVDISADRIIDSIIGEHGLAGEITAETRIVRAQLNELIAKLGGTPIDSIPGDGGYASGGLATKTGLAMLHGTANEPEYVLNARQTGAFLRLADVLPSIFGSGTGTTNNYGTNVYVELNMSVGEIGSDYDVDRLVARVKDDIYDASSYRNVNAVSFLR